MVHLIHEELFGGRETEDFRCCRAGLGGHATRSIDCAFAVGTLRRGRAGARSPASNPATSRSDAISARTAFWKRVRQPRQGQGHIKAGVMKASCRRALVAAGVDQARAVGTAPGPCEAGAFCVSSSRAGSPVLWNYVQPFGRARPEDLSRPATGRPTTHRQPPPVTGPPCLGAREQATGPREATPAGRRP